VVYSPVLRHTVQKQVCSMLSSYALYLCYDGFLDGQAGSGELSGGVYTDLSAWILALALWLILFQCNEGCFKNHLPAFGYQCTEGGIE